MGEGHPSLVSSLIPLSSIFTHSWAVLEWCNVMDPDYKRFTFIGDEEWLVDVTSLVVKWQGMFDLPVKHLCG